MKRAHSKCDSQCEQTERIRVLYGPEKVWRTETMAENDDRTLSAATLQTIIDGVAVKLQGGAGMNATQDSHGEEAVRTSDGEC